MIITLKCLSANCARFLNSFSSMKPSWLASADLKTWPLLHDAKSPPVRRAARRSSALLILPSPFVSNAVVNHRLNCSTVITRFPSLDTLRSMNAIISECYVHFVVSFEARVGYLWCHTHSVYIIYEYIRNKECIQYINFKHRCVQIIMMILVELILLNTCFRVCLIIMTCLFSLIATWDS